MEVRGGTVFLFEPRSIARSALAIHKLKDEGEYLSRISSRTGQVTEIMATDAEGTYADTTCVVFLQDVNVFGLVRGNSGAPTASRVAEWLTRIEPLKQKGLRFQARALLSKPELDKVLRADGAKKLELDLPVEALDTMGVSLAMDAKKAQEVAPGSSVKLSLSYGHANPGVDGRRGLLDTINNLLGRGLGDVSHAQATLVHEVPAARKGKTKLESDTIDLLETQLAKQFPVYRAGEGVTIDGTITGLTDTIQRHSQEILRSWERSGETRAD